MSNTYKVGEIQVGGCNLKSAVESLGFIVNEIIPKWRGRSNGLYVVKCIGGNILSCEWIEKRKELGLWITSSVR